MKANWIVLAAALQGTQLGGMRLAGIILAAVGFVLIAAGIAYGRGGKKEAAYKPNKTNKPEAITVTAESIIGDRKYQQDFFLFTPDTNSEAVKDSGMLAIVCDGMGGMEGGEIASRMCAELVYNGYYQMGKVDDVCQVLKELVTAADDEVSAITDQSGRKLRSGTTAIAVVVRGSKAYWVSAETAAFTTCTTGGSRGSRATITSACCFRSSATPDTSRRRRSRPTARRKRS